jgi:hypothetical protein
MKPTTNNQASATAANSSPVLRELGGWLFMVALTSLACLIAWRLSLALGSALMLCAAYAAPAAISMRSLAQSFVSFCAVTVVGTFLLQDAGPGSRLAFTLVGLSFAAGVFHLTLAAGEKLAEARRALGIVRMRSSTTQDAVQRAGVCLVVVGKHLAWLSVNEAAWNAFGSDGRLRRGMDARVELDDEAATALMHSGSRESWRKFHESVIADSVKAKLKPGEALPPYRVTLYDIAGRKTRYRFTVTAGQRDELVFVGFPESSQEHEPGEGSSPAAWFEEVVSSFSEPSVIVQSDGAIMAANGSFKVLCGSAGHAEYIFDCPRVHGVTERHFSSSIWLPTRTGAKDLPEVFLEGAGPAVGARISPPKAAYTEAVLIVFKEENRPVPDGFNEVTKPMEL